MHFKNKTIYIIGAGVSGLTAANYLESKGFKCVIIESSDTIGGRVKTDIVNNYQLDHGFQVLLTAYPLAQKYLDYNKLELQNLSPGAKIFNSSKNGTIIGDPLKDISFLWGTINTEIATIKDKILIFKLSNRLKNESIENIFSKKSVSTLEYLKDIGFSNKVIFNFFKPFYTGIFLENNLNTSSIMFEYIFKMFAEGYAAIPKSGMKAIPEQLRQNLTKTKFIFNSRVSSINDGIISLHNGSTFKSNFIINSTEFDFTKNTNRELKWNSCENLYFEVGTDDIKKPLIGLIARENKLINNVFYPTSIQTNTKGDKELLSVTIVKKHSLSDFELVNKIKVELTDIFGEKDFEFIKKYTLKKALPVVKELNYDNKSTIKTSNILNIGDIRTNPTLNSAMLSGEIAAKKIVDKMITIS